MPRVDRYDWKGVCQLSLDGLSQSCFLLFLSHVRMLYNPLALQFGLSQDDYDVVCSALHGVSNEPFKQLKVIVISKIIPEAWLARVRRLLA